jgi:hypothetical protein
MSKKPETQLPEETVQKEDTKKKGDKPHTTQHNKTS